MVHVPFCLGTMKQSSSHSPWQPDSPGIPKHSRRLILKRSDTESFLAQMPTRWLRARNNALIRARWSLAKKYGVRKGNRGQLDKQATVIAQVATDNRA
ncbi:unnamed protein product [Penicillium roqueforti FM164]|uniref:Genomic scaffold, ProqFM164S03 n=1 Tax=Penicillium roqueforti (strain FM164) TaxID=1365484 RepID=W6QDH9_PENRF|nr:unnamed protein product [Penicillium roqueforti FM164]